MFQKTVEKEKHYTKEQINRIRGHFEELKKAGKSKSVQRYAKKVEAKLKA